MASHRQVCGLVGLTVFIVTITVAQGQFQWFKKDKFDEIWKKIHLINKDTCVTARPSDLTLPLDVVTQIPDVRKAEIVPLRRNRTGIMHVYNMAINRAFFWSYVLQRLYDGNEPGLQYYYLAANADVMSNKVVNASSLIFDNRCAYPNFYYNFFNKTLPLFGPSCYRDDNDYEDSTNWLGVPTFRTTTCNDLGAGAQSNYTNPYYRPKMNPWYQKWMPDMTKDGTKAVYTITLERTDNKTGQPMQQEKFSVYGPPAPEDDPGPVNWTAPYFDCGGSNKWVVSAVSPIVDLYPRHPWAFINGEKIEWRHVQYQKYVAMAIMNIDLIRVDLNQCPRDETERGQEYNYFAGTARCKPTTMCLPLHHHGFARGGYECICKPGYRYPFWQRGPFQGRVIERATNEEYERNFDCLKVRDRYVIPDQSGTAVNPDIGRGDVGSFVGRKKRSVEEAGADDASVHVEEAEEEERKKRDADATDDSPSIKDKEFTAEEVNERFKRQVTQAPSAKQQSLNAIEEMYKDIIKKESFTGFHRLYKHLRQLNDIKEDNCQKQGSMSAENLTMPGDVAYNVHVFFDEQARNAVRLAKFISNYMQTVDPNEKFTGRKGDHILSEEELFGEVLASVVSDRKVWGTGVFWDLNAYPKTEGRPRFGPYAYPTELKQQDNKEKKDTRKFKVKDMAGDVMRGGYNDYLEEKWFKNMKARWRTTVDDLNLETQKMNIRSSPLGTKQIRFEHYPQQYFSPDYEDGIWTNPYFNCGGPIYHWLLSYVIPFFGPNNLGRGTLEFKGVVKVDVKLRDLDMNQCDMDAWVPNAFKNTHRCDRETTYCEPYPEQGFKTGAYMCHCKQGYEYPWEDIGRWYDGQQMELQYSKKIRGTSNRYDRLKCRLAGAAGLKANVLSVAILAIGTFIVIKSQ